MTEVAEPLREFPPAPRPLSRRASRRAWGDLHVRFWWISAAAIATIMLIITIDRFQAALRERDLIRNGVELRATVIEMEGSRRVGYTLHRTDNLDVKLRTTLPDGRETTLEGSLPAAPSATALQIGRDIIIKVDPQNPSRWTGRTEMAGWAVEMVIPLMMLPLIALLLGIAMLHRARVIRIWREGQPVIGVVQELKHSAIAPLSRLVRFNIPELAEHRLLSALIPNSAGIPKVGEAIQLVAEPPDLSRAVVVKLYVGADLRVRPASAHRADT